MTTTPRTVVISGAARGIGRAAALHLDQLGWQVFAGVRQPDHAAALRAVASPRMVPVQCDLTDYASLHHAAAVVAQHLDGRGLDGLINNAGIVIPGPLEYLPLDDLHTQLAVGLVGQLALTQQMLPLLRPRRGRIINISSGSGRLVRPLLAAYSAAKFGLEALSDGLRLELAPSGIRVIVIQPGATATPAWAATIERLDAVLAALPDPGRRTYGAALRQLHAVLTATVPYTTPPEQVAATIAHALQTPYPRARYTVGRGAWRDVLLSYLPDRLRDRLMQM
ncbi:MAG: SDR family NAD(P)-dependent oxidoreductase [Chloroflexaceae bacterium]|nr:SDR family NAD(P)-dependent oxidoreductase [Chloroflexaceae bacterium]